VTSAIPIRSKADLDALRRHIRPLVGQTCWRARLAYADELKLDLGGKSPYKSAKMKGHVRGSWTLASRGTTWTLELAGTSISSRSRRPKIEGALRELKGDVKSITIGYRSLSLTIRFTNGSTLTIEHETRRPMYGLPYWEIFTPERACIQAGPGRRWARRLKVGRP
jgi:hypothetical protein